MKQVKIISPNEMRSVIRETFDGDNDLFQYYDPTKKVSNVDQVADDIVSKINEYQESSSLSGLKCLFCKVYLVHSDGQESVSKLVGYYFFQYSEFPSSVRLVSFGVKKEFRTKTVLKSFFEEMRINMGDPFVCTLFWRNSRAINWLLKCGMKIKEVHKMKLDGFDDFFIVDLLYNHKKSFIKSLFGF